MPGLTELNPIPSLPEPRERMRLRMAFGVTQAQIARELGVTRKSIYRWETGESEPTGTNRIEYARILDAWKRKERNVR